MQVENLTVETATAATNAVTLTLTAPGINNFHRIHWISWYGNAAPTLVDIDVQTNAGSTQTRVGGASANMPGVLLFPGGIPCTVNNATKIVLTTTGGLTSVRVSAGWTQGVK